MRSPRHPNAFRVNNGQEVRDHGWRHGPTSGLVLRRCRRSRALACCIDGDCTILTHRRKRMRLLKKRKAKTTKTSLNPPARLLLSITTLRFDALRMRRHATGQRLFRGISAPERPGSVWLRGSMRSDVLALRFANIAYGGTYRVDGSCFDAILTTMRHSPGPTQRIQYRSSRDQTRRHGRRQFCAMLRRDCSSAGHALRSLSPDGLRRRGF